MRNALSDLEFHFAKQSKSVVERLHLDATFAAQKFKINDRSAENRSFNFVLASGWHHVTPQNSWNQRPHKRS